MKILERKYNRIENINHLPSFFVRNVGDTRGKEDSKREVLGRVEALREGRLYVINVH
jgi:hypothetical protein